MATSNSDKAAKAKNESNEDAVPVAADVVDNPEPEVVAEGETVEEDVQPADGYPSAPVSVPEGLTAEDEYDYENPEPRSEEHVPDVSLAVTSHEEV